MSSKLPMNLRLFLSQEYLTDEIRCHLSSELGNGNIEFHPYNDVLPVLTNMSLVPGKVWVSYSSLQSI